MFFPLAYLYYTVCGYSSHSKTLAHIVPIPSGTERAKNKILYTALDTRSNLNSFQKSTQYTEQTQCTKWRIPSKKDLYRYQIRKNHFMYYIYMDVYIQTMHILLSVVSRQSQCLIIYTLWTWDMGYQCNNVHLSSPPVDYNCLYIFFL